MTMTNYVEYRDAIIDQFRNLQTEDHCALYCVTNTFGESKSKTIDFGEAFKLYENFYVRVLRHVVDQNYSRPNKRRLHPVAIAWLDMPGIKAKPEPRRSARFLNVPHFHATYAVHESLKDKFEELMRDEIFERQWRDISTGNIRCFVEPVRDLEQWTRYATAYLPYMPDRLLEDYMHLIPCRRVIDCSAISEKAMQKLLNRASLRLLSLGQFA